MAQQYGATASARLNQRTECGNARPFALLARLLDLGNALAGTHEIFGTP